MKLVDVNTTGIYLRKAKESIYIFAFGKNGGRGFDKLSHRGEWRPVQRTPSERTESANRNNSLGSY